MHIAHLLQEISDELDWAVSEFPPFHGPHEGYAVIKEELDELWDEVKKKREVRSKEAMRREAIQVAAMAIRFVSDLCEEE